MFKISIAFLFSILILFSPYQNERSNSRIGEIIKGDFNGDGKIETAQLVKIKQGFGNPIEDGTSDEFEIQFSNKKIKPIKIGCCNAILVNEGDLNNKKGDEISIYQAPMNGCTYSMSTYTYSKSEWKTVVDLFLIPTACENFSFTEIDNLVLKENNTIYYYTIDPNEGNLIKHKVIK
ncbi:hypothetical protein [Flavobacterium sp. I3-2]|uniref:hypothetical protein n=1 Tax=Flavobacterium sp. I3-2 TaxID=2748319 RepID=UPI0015B11BB4|nr:hypothetical protein [Flavobacterium sp. I3-2]